MPLPAPPSPPPTQTFVQHLDELRRRLVIALAAFAAASAMAFFASERLVRWLLAPLASESRQLYFFSPQEAFVVRMKTALVAGFIAASPVILAQAWLFVAPALKSTEKRALLPLTAVTTALFLAGVATAYWLVAPAAVRFLLGMRTPELVPMLSVNDTASFLSSLLLSFGVAFTLPVAVVALCAAGVLKPESLNRYQKQIILLIFIAAAVLTPGPDLVSQLFLALPLLALFEVSVGAAFLMRRRA
jgi:sec-independent protein translocase protein TatC